MRQTIIGIAGPIGVGKTWTCKKLQEEFGSDFLQYTLTGRFIWDKYKDTVPGWGLHVSYEDFKNSFIPETAQYGRDSLINFIEGHRQRDLTWLAKQVWPEVAKSQAPIYILDSFGNAAEFEYYQTQIYLHNYDRTPERFDYIHVNIGCNWLNAGDPYPGDSRLHIEIPWARRYDNSGQAFEDLCRSLRNLQLLKAA